MRNLLNCTGYDPVGIEIVRADDFYLFDINGNKYVDFESGVWCTCLGHNHHRINSVIRKQLDQIAHIGYRCYNRVVEEAADELVKIAHFENGKVIFLSSGSEAVELSVQIIRQISDKPLLLTFIDSYLAAYGSAGKKNKDEWFCFDWSVCSECKFENCIQRCEHFSKIPFDKISGFVFEPGNSSGLIKFPPNSLIESITKKIKSNDGFIIANEITTGMGRTGEWFGYQHYNVKPDIIAVGKGLGNSYPVSAVVMNSFISIELEKRGFRYAQSHQNDPLGCAVAKEVIQTLRDERLIERCKRIGTHFINSLKVIAEESSVIKDVRGRGLMIAIEFESNNNFSLEKTFRYLIKAGYLPGYKLAFNTFRFYPPFTIEEKIITSFTEELKKLLGVT